MTYIQPTPCWLSTVQCTQCTLHLHTVDGRRFFHMYFWVHCIYLTYKMFYECLIWSILALFIICITKRLYNIACTRFATMQHLCPSTVWKKGTHQQYRVLAIKCVCFYRWNFGIIAKDLLVEMQLVRENGFTCPVWISYTTGLLIYIPCIYALEPNENWIWKKNQSLLLF